MKTQISRDTYRPDKRYSGVYQQQGRMITDADWNELMELIKRRLDDGLTDVVGSGSPGGRGVQVTELTETGFTIKSGHVYADGVMAQVVSADPKKDSFGYAEQADFPQAPSPPTDSYEIYADVWERTAVSLEDEDLRDAALHGADTTARTQTMAQVKWCDSADSPERPADNPQQGTAPLTLILRKKLEEKDPCDPCAQEVKEAARTGNYLFRLEVHDVQGLPSDPTHLTLKWSSENGAEQHAVPTPPAKLPADFIADDWIYEFYSLTSEKHLGVHLAPNFKPMRGQLKRGFPAPLPNLPLVRRWDGYCILERDEGNWSLDEGWDRGVELSETSAVDAHGHVDLGDSLDVKLEALTLNLTLNQSTFVVGDYWLAPVREAFHTAGDPLLEATPPHGIKHHYLSLARVDADGKLEAHPAADRRRLNFPSLTDLSAEDVAYKAHKDCEELKPAKTVQEALDRLCMHPTGGGPSGRACKTTVGAGGDFELLEQAIEELLAMGQTDLCLCLLPGNHNLPHGLDIAQPRTHLRIVGCGRASRLLIGSRGLCFTDLDSVGLHNLSVDHRGSDGLIIAGCRDVGLQDVELVGFADERENPLLAIAGARRIHLSHNLFEARFKPALTRPQRILGQRWGPLFHDFDRVRFDREVVEVSLLLADLPQQEREALVGEINSRIGDHWGKLTSAEVRAYQELTHALLISRVASASLAQMLCAIRFRTLAASQPAAVFIEDASAVTTINYCEVVGRMQFYGRGLGTDLDLENGRLEGNVETCGPPLLVGGNRLTSLTVGEEMLERLHSIEEEGGGHISAVFGSAQITDNTFVSQGNQLISGFLNLTGNVFHTAEIVGWTVARSAVYLGNQAEQGQLYHLFYGEVEDAANTLEIMQ